MKGRAQGRGVPGPVQHSKGWGPDDGARRTPCEVEPRFPVGCTYFELCIQSSKDANSWRLLPVQQVVTYMHVPNQVGTRCDMGCRIGPSKRQAQVNICHLGPERHLWLSLGGTGPSVVGGHRRSSSRVLQHGEDFHCSEVGRRLVSRSAHTSWLPTRPIEDLRMGLGYLGMEAAREAGLDEKPLLPCAAASPRLSLPSSVFLSFFSLLERREEEKKRKRKKGAWRCRGPTRRRCMSVVETRGVRWAWATHFLRDPGAWGRTCTCVGERGGVKGRRAYVGHSFGTACCNPTGSWVRPI